MKKTLKMMLVILLGMIVMGAMSGCKKEVLYKYKYFGLEDLYYITGNESTVRAFFSDLDAVMNRFDGTHFKDSELIAAVQKVVTQYNWNVIKGTFYLKKSPKDANSWTTIKSFTMKYNYYYNSPGKMTENEFGEVKCSIQIEDN